ncbi:MAG: transcriptional repressor LexA [Candidatus Hydrogenedentota bacterium]
MARPLTKRQAAILQFIAQTIQDQGYPPTLAEIGAHFGIRSTNGVTDHLVALERKGYLTRSSKARSLHVTEKGVADLYEAEPNTLPLVGRVAAGQPLFAEENIEGRVTVDPAHVREGAFCLRVNGESMVEAGILDGDLIVVDPSRRPRKGDVVVAMVEDEATVKRLYPEGAWIRLEPANSAMHPIVAPAHTVSIQGVVIALQRRLV